MKTFKMTSHDLRHLPRLNCRLRERCTSDRSLNRAKKTGLGMLAHLIKLTIKHWFK